MTTKKQVIDDLSRFAAKFPERRIEAWNLGMNTHVDFKNQL